MVPLNRNKVYARLVVHEKKEQMKSKNKITMIYILSANCEKRREKKRRENKTPQEII